MQSKSAHQEYLLKHEPLFARLYKLQQEVQIPSVNPHAQPHEDDISSDQGLET
jgi:hypothetical protein